MKKTGTKDNMIGKNLSISNTAVVSDLSKESTFDKSVTLTEINTSYVSATNINNERHRWYVCFGVPYATHLWQVNDASRLNGTFKIELTKAKWSYVLHWDARKFEPTDIIPLTNMAFPKSFGNSLNAKRAFDKRGWNPLNYYLLAVPPHQEVVDLTAGDAIKDKENDPSPLMWTMV
jgi:hypothetical protein